VAQVPLNACFAAVTLLRGLLAPVLCAAVDHFFKQHKVSLGPKVAARRASSSGLGSGIGGGLGGGGGEKVASDTAIGEVASASETAANEVGSSGDGDEPGSGALLWCLCVLHNSLARDLRLHTDNPGARSPAMHQR
jgi:hypothetical protein